MVVAAFTIGSFGDILGVLQLAWQIRESLSDAAAASEEIQTLISDINSFRHALDSAHSTLKRAPHVPQSVHNGVVHIMRVCTTLLRQVQTKVSVRHQEVVKKHGPRVWRGLWAACAWEMLGGKGDVEKMKRRLVEQAAALQTLLSVLQSAALVQIDKCAGEDRATMNRMLQLLEALPPLMNFDEVTVPFLFFLPNPESVSSGVAPMTRMTLEQFLAVIRLSLTCQLERDRRLAESDGHDYSLVPKNELRLVHFPLDVTMPVPDRRGKNPTLYDLHGGGMAKCQLSQPYRLTTFSSAFSLYYYRHTDPRFGQDMILISPPFTTSSSPATRGKEYWTNDSMIETFYEEMFRQIRAAPGCNVQSRIFEKNGKPFMAFNPLARLALGLSVNMRPPPGMVRC